MAAGAGADPRDGRGAANVGRLGILPEFNRAGLSAADAARDCGRPGERAEGGELSGDSGFRQVLAGAAKTVGVLLDSVAGQDATDNPPADAEVPGVLGVELFRADASRVRAHGQLGHVAADAARLSLCALFR